MNYLTRKEAATLLDLGPRQITRLTSEGFLTVRYEGLNALYDPDEIATLARLRKEKVSFMHVAVAAKRAEAVALRTERTLNQVLSVIQADLPLLKYDRESIESLHIRVEDALKEKYHPPTGEIFKWAKTFYSIGEEYFGAVATYLELEEPWELYIELAGRLCVEQKFATAMRDPEMATAYGCLNMARRTMRQAAFFYVQRNHGKRIACNLFPESKADVQEDLIAIAMAFETGGVFS